MWQGEPAAPQAKTSHASTWHCPLPYTVLGKDGGLCGIAKLSGWNVSLNVPRPPAREPEYRMKGVGEGGDLGKPGFSTTHLVIMGPPHPTPKCTHAPGVRGNGEFVFKGDRVPVWKEEKVQERDDHNGCTAS